MLRVFRNKINRKIVQIDEDDEHIGKYEGNPEWKELIEL